MTNSIKDSVSKRLALSGFKRFMRSANKVLLDRYDRHFSLQVQETAKKIFAGLINDIPYIGGRKNPYSSMLINAAVILSLYRALQPEGVSLEAFGEILEDITRSYMNHYPAYLRKLAGKLWMSRLFYKLLIRQARISQLRTYEDDFVYEVVPGDGHFKWGMNYSECGITKFLYKKGEAELAKYACTLDYLMFPAIGVTLERTGTIAHHCEQCDFRFS